MNSIVVLRGLIEIERNLKGKKEIVLWEKSGKISIMGEKSYYTIVSPVMIATEDDGTKELFLRIISMDESGIHIDIFLREGLAIGILMRSREYLMSIEDKFLESVLSDTMSHLNNFYKMN